MTDANRAALKALVVQRDAMEREILDIQEALSADNLGGVNTPIVDREGFPRADIDVHTTLTLRNKLVKLNNDHKALMARIEAGLMGALPPLSSQPTGGGAAAAAARAPAPPPAPVRAPAPAPPRATPAPAPAPAPAADATGSPAGVGSTGPIPMDVIDVSDGSSNAAALQELEAFALIDEVAQEGPAAAAGVCVGDELLRFGSVHARNHDGLRALARLTQRSEGEALSLLVRRKVSPTIEVSGGGSGEGAVAVQAMQHVRLELRPRRWAGNGLLGCHLRPL